MNADRSQSQNGSPDAASPVAGLPANDERSHDGGMAADVAVEVAINAAPAVAEAVGGVVSSVLAALGSIG